MFLTCYFFSSLFQGLVVPVIRNADKMNFAEIEKEINTLAKKATAGSISIDEMAGGSFTISNGGVYGSLLSTPIINPPQVKAPCAQLVDFSFLPFIFHLNMEREQKFGSFVWHSCYRLC